MKGCGNSQEDRIPTVLLSAGVNCEESQTKKSAAPWECWGMFFFFLAGGFEMVRFGEYRLG